MRRGLAVLGVAATILLPSCDGGDDGNDDDAAPTTVVSTTTTSAGASTTSPDVRIELKGGGLVIGDAALDFGTEYQTVVDAVTEALGTPSDETEPEDCEGGADRSHRWDELATYAMDGEFVGWSATPTSPLETVEGIGLDSTRANLEVTFAELNVFESSLGTEFATRDDETALSGVLEGPEPNAPVEALWSGNSCIFR